MKTKELFEGVVDIASVKRKPLIKRTPREQAVLDAAKSTKPKTGKVEVHIKLDTGKVIKERFKLTMPENRWEEEANQIANKYFTDLLRLHERFPGLQRPIPVSIEKVIIK